MPGLSDDLKGLRRALLVTEEVADHPAKVVLWVREEGVQLNACWAVLGKGSQPAHHLQATTSGHWNPARLENRCTLECSLMLLGRGGTFHETHIQRMELACSTLWESTRPADGGRVKFPLGFARQAISFFS